jgi:hypothetical protein
MLSRKTYRACSIVGLEEAAEAGGATTAVPADGIAAAGTEADGPTPSAAKPTTKETRSTSGAADAELRPKSTSQPQRTVKTAQDSQALVQDALARLAMLQQEREESEAG